MAPAQGVLCGAAHRLLYQACSSPTQGQEKTFLAIQWKYQGSAYVPLSLEIPVPGECLCSELHLCFTAAKIREGSGLQELEFPKAPDRVANHI